MTIQVVISPKGCSVEILPKTDKEINDWYDETEMIQNHENWVMREYELTQPISMYLDNEYPTFKHP